MLDHSLLYAVFFFLPFYFKFLKLFSSQDLKGISILLVSFDALLKLTLLLEEVYVTHANRHMMPFGMKSLYIGNIKIINITNIKGLHAKWHHMTVGMGDHEHKLNQAAIERDSFL